MNPPRLSPDDLRLTAYALGELEGADHAEIDAAVRGDPALQAAVAEIRTLAGELSGALGREPAAVRLEPAVDPYRGKMVRFPYYIVSGLAAACFAVVAVLQQDAPTEPERRTFELNLASEAAPAPAEIADATATFSAAAAERAPAMRQAVAVSSSGLVAPPRVVRSGRPDAGFLRTADAPRSVLVPRFDPAGYARLRGSLEAGVRPGAGAVQIEDLINHFASGDVAPTDEAPVAADLEVAAAPWNPAHRLVRIGLRARAATGPAGTQAVAVRGTRFRVDFNPARVASYRLIGYETRPADAGADDGADLHTGQRVIALYEIVPAEGPLAPDGELLTLRVDYRLPEEGTDRGLDLALRDGGVAFAEASADFKFAAAVAGFGLLLQDSPFKGNASYDDVVVWAEAGLAEATPRAAGPVGSDRPDFIRLVRRVRSGTNG